MTMFLYYDKKTKEVRMMSNAQLQAGNLLEIELDVSDEDRTKLGNSTYYSYIKNSQLEIIER